LQFLGILAILGQFYYFFFEIFLVFLHFFGQITHQPRKFPFNFRQKLALFDANAV